MKLSDLKAAIVFLGPATYDSRIKNLIFFFRANTIPIRALCFDWLSTKNISDSDIFKNVSNIRLNRKNSLAFYFKYYFWLFKFLTTEKYNIVFVEEVYSLAPSILIGKFKKAKIIYNSRELYPFLGGLTGKKIKQAFWSFIEKFFIKFCDAVSTTGPLDTEFIKEYYRLKIPTVTLRNLPLYQDCLNIEKFNFIKYFNLPEGSTILLYVGILAKGRGIEQAIKAVEQFQNLYFIIIGDGDFKDEFKKIAESSKTKDRIIFFGRVSNQELLKYISGGDIGLCYIENISKSYYYALPNKLFEYIMAGTPVIGSSLPQIKDIIEKYKVGEVVDCNKPEELYEALKKLIEKKDLRKEYSQACLQAAKTLNWETESESLKTLLKNL
jgi:glycosyltransferase involved in cell wall biosynthesis